MIETGSHGAENINAIYASSGLVDAYLLSEIRKLVRFKRLSPQVAEVQIRRRSRQKPADVLFRPAKGQPRCAL